MPASPKRRLQSLLSRILFWGRRRFLEPTLDPERDSVVLPVATHSPWLQDPDFQRAYRVIDANTLVDMYRCWELWHLAGQVRAVEGDVIEVGVWRGGTGALLASRFAQLDSGAPTVHLCDTFTGVVKASEADSHYQGGEHADTSESVVRELLKTLGVDNVRIHVGIFPDDAPSEMDSLSYRLVHIDVDVYESARQIFDWCWERLSNGGVVIFDDFGFSTTRGITRLCDEIAARPDTLLIHNLNGHAVVVKYA